MFVICMYKCVSPCWQFIVLWKVGLGPNRELQKGSACTVQWRKVHTERDKTEVWYELRLKWQIGMDGRIRLQIDAGNQLQIADYLNRTWSVITYSAGVVKFQSLSSKIHWLFILETSLLHSLFEQRYQLFCYHQDMKYCVRLEGLNYYSWKLMFLTIQSYPLSALCFPYRCFVIAILWSCCRVLMIRGRRVRRRRRKLKEEIVRWKIIDVNGK